MAKLPAKIEDQRKEIVEKVAEDMETMGAEWLRPWASLGMPRNPVTGSEYHGSNALYLLAVAAWKGYGDPRWATFNQAKKNGWKLRKGSKAVAVEHWRSVVKDLTDSEGNPVLDKDGKPRKVRHLYCDGYYNVFNLSCFEGAPEIEQAAEHDDTEIGVLADELIASRRCPVKEAPSEKAFYSPSRDSVTVPLRGQFKSNAAFVGILLHEMGHATAPALEREQKGRFGDSDYAFEELVAELSSLFASCELGVPIERDESDEHYARHVAYLRSWSEGIKEDPDALFKAAAAAGKAATYNVERWSESTGKQPAAAKAPELPISA